MSYKKHILLIAMLDSIHTARWLEQFAGQDLEFTIFPSKKFKHLHPKLLNLIARGGAGQFKLYRHTPLSTSGYDDFLRLNSWISKDDSRQSTLNRLIAQLPFDYIHAMEMQGAGYLLSESTVPKQCKTIISNWGSDIFYFKRFEEHFIKIKKALSRVDAYSAECVRDYDLAKDLGFKGIFLPCIPNAGGHFVPAHSKLPTERSQIIVKGYGGVFGRAEEVIRIAEEVLKKYMWVNFFFYSVTKDNLESLKELKRKFGNRVSLRRVEDKLSHSQMQQEFQKSRIYIGCSISDGISTSFLEALANGAFPIQTNTSCANEWIAKGAIASLVDVDGNEILKEIEWIIENNPYLELAFAANRKVALENLDSHYLKKLSEEFYKI